MQICTRNVSTGVKNCSLQNQVVLRRYVEQIQIVHLSSCSRNVAELKPFIECSIVQRVIPYSNVKQFKYMTVLIQEFHVKVDLLFINAIVDMLSTQLSEADAVSHEL